MSANDIEILLTEQEVEPGQQISGQIYLNIAMPVSNVTLRIIGEEYIKFVYYVSKTTGSGKRRRTKRIRKVAERSCNVFDFKNPLGANQGAFGFGQYQFPINFVMPSEAPSSFEYHNGSTEGWIRYRMILSAGGDTITKNLIVTKKNFPSLSQHNRINTAHELKCFCCIPKGNTKMNALFEKSSYCHGEVVRAIGSFDNKASKWAVSNFRTVVELTITFNAGFRSHSERITAGACNAGRIEAGEEKNNIPLAFQLTSDEKMPTTRSTFITANYILHMEAMMDATCNCGANPISSQPIAVYKKKDPYQQAQFQPRGNWKPQQMQAQNFSVNMAPGFGVTPPMGQQGQMPMPPPQLNQGMGMNPQPQIYGSQTTQPQFRGGTNAVYPQQYSENRPMISPQQPMNYGGN